MHLMHQDLCIEWLIGMFHHTRSGMHDSFY